MSYILNQNSDLFIKSKVTEKGREKIAKGSITYSNWAIGDSEINYDHTNESGSTIAGYKFLNPKDKQPNIKYFVYDGSSLFNTINNNNVNVEKIQLYNQKDEIGYFDDSDNTIITSPFIITSTALAKSSFGGTNILSINPNGVTNGDLMLVKYNSNSVSENETVSLALWYKVLSNDVTGLTLDKQLPNLESETGNTNILFYKNDEIKNIFNYGTPNLVFNDNLFSFQPENENIILSGSPVWNMNIVYSESLAGLNNSYPIENNNYLGTSNPYLNLFDTTTYSDGEIKKMNCGVITAMNDVNKSAAIIHYTNNPYYDGYGDYIYVDDSNKLEMVIPNILYHNRYFSDGNANLSGMKFASDTTVKSIDGTNIEYYDILEDTDYLESGATQNVIGKLFFGLHIILITDDEIVSALTYKSNRNYTLPQLDAELIDSPNGIIEAGKTIYLTYELNNNRNYGFKPSLPCQKYIKLYNNSSKNKDITFWIKNNKGLDYLTTGNTGNGFSANEFNLLYQIVDDYNARPNIQSWKKINISGTTSGYLKKNDITNSYFTVNNSLYATASDFNLVNDLNNNTGLYYGEEKFFYGNIKASAGTNIFKTIFNFVLDSAKFNKTTNPTHSLGQSLKVTEFNIFDNDGDLVIASKLSKPIELGDVTNVTVKVDIDF